MRHENERDRRSSGRRDATDAEPPSERDGLLRDMLRRFASLREPAVYVMDPDGKLRRS